MVSFLDVQIPKWRGLLLFSIIFGSYQSFKYGLTTGIFSFLFILFVTYFFEWINNNIKYFIWRTTFTLLFWISLAIFLKLLFSPKIEVLLFVILVPSVMLIGADIYEMIKKKEVSRYYEKLRK